METTQMKNRGPESGPRFFDLDLRQSGFVRGGLSGNSNKAPDEHADDAEGKSNYSGGLWDGGGFQSESKIGTGVVCVPGSEIICKIAQWSPSGCVESVSFFCPKC